MISIIVPCYNEQEALPLFHKEATRILQEIGEEYELLFVNDGSKDETLKELKALSAKDSHVIYLSFSRNFPPALLPEMLKILKTGEYDSVATRRVSREGEPIIRSWFARRFYSIMNRISESDIVDGARDFRLMKKSMVEAIVAMGEYNRFSKGLFGWVGFRTYWMPYENVERVAGETKWNFWKLFKYAIDGIINFSHVPLSIASWFGTTMSLTGEEDLNENVFESVKKRLPWLIALLSFFSFLALAVIIIRRLIFGDPVAGWASIICVVIFIGGIQLLCSNYGAVHIQDVSGDKTQTPFHYSRDE